MSAVAEVDLGDAPDCDVEQDDECHAFYPTFVQNNGARHLDSEQAWLGRANLRDDVQGDPVVHNEQWSGPLYVNILVDNNRDGDWDDDGEWQTRNDRYDLPPGKTVPASITIPSGTWVRVTLTGEPLDGYVGRGEFEIGETEDYFVDERKSARADSSDDDAPYCGDGILQPGEQCDPPGLFGTLFFCPAPTNCNANCQCVGGGDEPLPPVPPVGPPGGQPGQPQPKAPQGQGQPSVAGEPSRVPDRMLTGRVCNPPLPHANSPCEKCVRRHMERIYSLMCLSDGTAAEIRKRRNALRSSKLVSDLNSDARQFSDFKQRGRQRGMEFVNERWKRRKQEYDQRMGEIEVLARKWKEKSDQILDRAREIAESLCRDACSEAARTPPEECRSIVPPLADEYSMNDASKYLRLSGITQGSSIRVAGQQFMDWKIKKLQQPAYIVEKAEKIGSRREFLTEFPVVTQGKPVTTRDGCVTYTYTPVYTRVHKVYLVMERYRLDELVQFVNVQDAIVNVADVASGFAAPWAQLVWVGLNGVVAAVDKDATGATMEVADFMLTVGETAISSRKVGGPRAFRRALLGATEQTVSGNVYSLAKGTARGGKQIVKGAIKSGSKSIAKGATKQQLKRDVTSQEKSRLEQSDLAGHAEGMKRALDERIGKIIGSAANTIKVESTSNWKNQFLGENYYRVYGEIELPTRICTEIGEGDIGGIVSENRDDCHDLAPSSEQRRSSVLVPAREGASVRILVVQGTSGFNPFRADDVQRIDEVQLFQDGSRPGIPGLSDTDRDGFRDTRDNCPRTPNPDQRDIDGDGVGDACDGDTPPDSDGDGIHDAIDNCPSAANANQTDTDGDGSGDVCDDVYDTGSDGDGVRDATDNCPTTANANQTDTDGDGTGDVCDDVDDTDSDGDGVRDATDNCPTTANANQTDTDGDGTGDVCDDVDDTDSDGDGIRDAIDNCPAAANADQADIDGDGTGDVCDNRDDTDSDGDGVRDATDNCPTTANANQTDTDGDGTGDVCDNLDDTDSDGDGVRDAIDNCPATANADQTDTDGDGSGDVCDDVDDTDSDGDGVRDAVDNCPATANADQSDIDGDGTG
ncbi:MAG: thrombospondin type 3 repeat-containing protein, partial [Proteobacteria bacterium]|nr:thrombospondin type 3 repeat-containing protein [Pseudomonadota bacterium]